MRITILQGSPRPNGNTQALAEAFTRGAAESGEQIELLTLRTLRIKPCVDCKFCYSHPACTLRDDMEQVYAALAQTDILVFATPVHFYGLSAAITALLSRLHNPVRSSFPIKGTALLAVCADTGEETFAPLLTTYRANAQYLGWRDLGAVLADNAEEKGALLSRPELTQAYALGVKLGGLSAIPV